MTTPMLGGAGRYICKGKGGGKSGNRDAMLEGFHLRLLRESSHADFTNRRRSNLFRCAAVGRRRRGSEFARAQWILLHRPAKRRFRCTPPPPAKLKLAGPRTLGL